MTPVSQQTIFATTRWTLVREAAQGGDTQAVAALGELFGTYWPPLYRYARRLGHGAPDAEDLVSWGQSSHGNIHLRLRIHLLASQ